MKIKKSRLVAILLTLLILCGAANVSVAADTPWDVRAALTRETDQGEKRVNEELLQLAQDVRQTVSGEYLRITTSDALYDGRTLIMTWEVENLSEEQVIYLVGTTAEDSVHWRGGLMIGGPDDVFVAPGQTRNEFMDGEIVESVEGDTMRVGIHYFVLAPTAEVIVLQYPDPVEEDYAKKLEIFDTEAKAGTDEGKMMIATMGNGQLMFADWGSSFFEEINKQYELLGGECTPVEAMIGTGRLKLLEELEVAFDLKVNQKPVSMLPNGDPAEKAYEDFTMRVTRADYTIGTMEIILEAVFADEASANQFERDNRLFVALDEKGMLIRDGGTSTWGTTGLREARDDGTYMVEYGIWHRELFALPEYVTVCPAASSMISSDASNDSAEGVVLSIR